MHNEVRDNSEKSASVAGQYRKVVLKVQYKVTMRTSVRNQVVTSRNPDGRTMTDACEGSVPSHIVMRTIAIEANDPRC